MGDSQTTSMPSPLGVTSPLDTIEIPAKKEIGQIW